MVHMTWRDGNEEAIHHEAHALAAALSGRDPELRTALSRLVDVAPACRERMLV
jgi:hypothetical protein